MKTVLKVGLLIIIVVGIFLFWFVNQLAPKGHGSDGGYVFQESKYDLEKLVDSILQLDSGVFRKPFSPPSIDDNYYNTNGYFTVIADSVEYTFRYYGDSLEWHTSKDSSEIFIASITEYSKVERPKYELKELIEERFVNKLIKASGKEVRFTEGSH